MWRDSLQLFCDCCLWEQIAFLPWNWLTFAANKTDPATNEFFHETLNIVVLFDTGLSVYFFYLAVWSIITGLPIFLLCADINDSSSSWTMNLALNDLLACCRRLENEKAVERRVTSFLLSSVPQITMKGIISNYSSCNTFSEGNWKFQATSPWSWNSSPAGPEFWLQTRKATQLGCCV